MVLTISFVSPPILYLVKSFLNSSLQPYAMGGGSQCMLTIYHSDVDIMIIGWSKLFAPKLYLVLLNQLLSLDTGCFFLLHWYPPKKFKYGKPRLGESTLT